MIVTVTVTFNLLSSDGILVVSGSDLHLAQVSDKASFIVVVLIYLDSNLIRALIYKYASEPPIGIFLHPVDFILLCGLSPKGV